MLCLVIKEVAKEFKESVDQSIKVSQWQFREELCSLVSILPEFFRSVCTIPPFYYCAVEKVLNLHLFTLIQEVALMEDQLVQFPIYKLFCLGTLFLTFIGWQLLSFVSRSFCAIFLKNMSYLTVIAQSGAGYEKVSS